MSTRICLYNGVGETERYQYRAEGSPIRFGGTGPRYMRFWVRKLPAGEHLPCGIVSVSVRWGQKEVTLERLEREFEEQRMERIEAAMARGEYDDED